MRYLRAAGICLLLLSSLAVPAAAETEEREGSGSGTSAPAKASANGLSLQGTLTYNYVYSGSSGTLRMAAAEVRNSRIGGTSGTLRLVLWATTTAPVFGQTISAYTLGTYTLGQLVGGTSFLNVDTGIIGFTTPPSGTYYITMALQEYDGTQYVYQDFSTFSQLQTFGTAPCIPTSTALCLNSAGRLRFSVAWRVPSQGTNGAGQAVSLSSDSGYFWFFNSANVELVIKTVDGRALNGRFWVFYGALSNVEYTITVTDTVTGAVRTYFNPSGRLASVADTEAF